MLKHQETYLESYWSPQSWLVSTDKANRGKQSIWTAPIHENWAKTEAFVQIARLGQKFGTHCVHKSLRILVTLNHFVLTSLAMIVCFKCCSDGGFVGWSACSMIHSNTFIFCARFRESFPRLHRPQPRMQTGGSRRRDLSSVALWNFHWSENLHDRRRTDEQWTMVRNSDEDSKQ